MTKIKLANFFKDIYSRGNGLKLIVIKAFYKAIPEKWILIYTLEKLI